MTHQNVETIRGFWLAAICFGLWGVFPIYFHWLREVKATEILAHRVLWSMLLLLVLSRFRQSKTHWVDLLKSKKTLIPCLFSAFFLNLNWLIYTWAVGHQMTIEGSLGYFINPLISVLLAVLFLSERLNRYQILAVSIAAAGVGFMIFKVGEIPFVALSLAISFGTYGLIHKRYAVDAFAGLTVETVIAAPFMLIYLIYLIATEQSAFISGSATTKTLLASAGFITTLPLLLFLASLSQLRLSSVGLMQYITPSLQFMVAIYILGEQFSKDKLIAFMIIWAGICIYCFDIIRLRREKNLNKKIS